VSFPVVVVCVSPIATDMFLDVVRNFEIYTLWGKGTIPLLLKPPPKKVEFLHFKTWGVVGSCGREIVGGPAENGGRAGRKTSVI